jgi:hypothetical protein
MSFFFFFFFLLSLLYNTPMTSKRYKGYYNGTKDKGKGNDNMMVSGVCLGSGGRALAVGIFK